MKLHDEIRNAIGAHGLWKGRLQSAIDTSSSEYSAETIQRDDQCDFGKWMKGVTEPAIRNSEAYRKCLDLHRQFHKSAAGVLELAVTGKKEAAKKSMAMGSDFARMSAALTSAMMDWSRQVPQ